MRANRTLPAVAVALAALGSVRCDNVSCTDLNPDVGGSCVPGTVVPDQTSMIEVREACGQCSTQPQCDATLIDGAVNVQLHSQICNDRSCTTLLCLQRVVRCTLPSLPEGDWPLILPGNQTRLLRVRSGGTSSCRLQ